MRLAMMVCASIGSLVGYQVVDDRRGGHYVIGRDDPHWYDMLGGDDDRVRRRGHHRIEIARGQGVGKIAKIVGEKRMDQCEIGA